MTDNAPIVAIVISFLAGSLFTLFGMLCGAVLGEVAYHIAAKFSRLSPAKDVTLMSRKK